MQSPCLNTRVPPGGHNLPRVGSLSSESCFRLCGQHHRQVFVRPLQVYCLHHLPGEYSQQSWRASFFRLGLARWHFRARGLTSQRRPAHSLPAHEQPGNLPPVGFLFFFSQLLPLRCRQICNGHCRSGTAGTLCRDLCIRCFLMACIFVTNTNTAGYHFQLNPLHRRQLCDGSTIFGTLPR